MKQFSKVRNVIPFSFYRYVLSGARVECFLMTCASNPIIVVDKITFRRKFKF